MVQANPHLSIVIPTYNRADLLDLCLEILIPLARTHNVQIFISDNASTDGTKAIIEKRLIEYPLLRFYGNATNLGPDKNFERALKYPHTEYVWLLGDSYQIPPDGFEYVLGLITAGKVKYDAIILNASKRVSDIFTRDYSNQNQLLSDLGWHMTCMSCLIYSSELILAANFTRYYNTSFIQLGVIFEAISDNEFIIHWAQDQSVETIVAMNIVKHSWQDQTFDIWVRKWANFVFSLPPSYDLGIKLKCIKDHGFKSGLLTHKSLLRLRGLNVLNYKTYKQFAHLFPITIRYPRLLTLLIALVPQVISRNLMALKKTIKGC